MLKCNYETKLNRRTTNTIVSMYYSVIFMDIFFLCFSMDNKLILIDVIKNVYCLKKSDSKR